jgi:hypothetical protein
VGTAIMIYTNSSATTIPKLALSNKIVVGLGLISYSLYLWHWPTIVFYRYAFREPLGPIDIVIVLGVTGLASVFSWFYIEQPIRTRRVFEGRSAIFSLAFVASGCFVIASVLGIAMRGLPARLAPTIVALADGKTDVNPARDQCIGKEPENVLTDNFCRFGRDTLPALMVWGDSQADPWMPVFQELASQIGAQGIFAAHGGCPPLLGIRRVNQTATHKCMEFNNAVFAKIAKSHINSVVLIGRWSWYVYGVEQGGLEDGPGAIIARADEGNENADQPANRMGVFRTAIAETVRHLSDIGSQIWIIDQPPTYTFDVPKYLAYSAVRGIVPTGRTRADVRERHAFQLDVFHENNVTLIDTSE